MKFLTSGKVKDVYELEAGSYAWLNINNMDTKYIPIEILTNPLLAMIIVAEYLCGYRSRAVKVSCCEPPFSAIFRISSRVSRLRSASTAENSAVRIDKTTKLASLKCLYRPNVGSHS